MKHGLRAYGQLVAVLLFGCQSSSIDTEVTTFNAWQISQSQFCPEDHVIIFARVSNEGSTDVRLVLYGGNRALVQIRDSNGVVIWDTDEVARIEQARRIEEFGPEVVALTGVLLALKPDDSAFWISRWEQRDIFGELVEPGEYTIEVQYRWQYWGENADYDAILIPPATIIIADSACD